jgi:hypothetical protein
MYTRQNTGTNNIKFVLCNGSVLCHTVERYCRLTVLLCQKEYGRRHGSGGRKEERQPDGEEEGKGKEERGKGERLKGEIKQIRLIQVEENINNGE